MNVTDARSGRSSRLLQTAIDSARSKAGRHFVCDRDTDSIVHDRYWKRLHPLTCVSNAFPNIDPEGMKRALHGSSVESTLAKRPAGVRTTVVDRRDTFAYTEYGDFQTFMDYNNLGPSIGDLR